MDFLTPVLYVPYYLASYKYEELAGSPLQVFRTVKRTAVRVRPGFDARVASFGICRNHFFAVKALFRMVF